MPATAERKNGTGRSPRRIGENSDRSIEGGDAGTPFPFAGCSPLLVGQHLVCGPIRPEAIECEEKMNWGINSGQQLACFKSEFKRKHT